MCLCASICKFGKHCFRGKETVNVYICTTLSVYFHVDQTYVSGFYYSGLHANCIDKRAQSTLASCCVSNCSLVSSSPISSLSFFFIFTFVSNFNLNISPNLPHTLCLRRLYVFIKRSLIIVVIAEADEVKHGHMGYEVC